MQKTCGLQNTLPVIQFTGTECALRGGDAVSVFGRMVDAIRYIVRKADMVLLALCQWSVFLSGSADESLWGLLLIPVATRACAGLAVLKLRPMGTSQYAAMGRHGGYAAALAVLLAAAIAVPLVTDRSFAPLAAAAGYGLAVWYGFRQLDGMNGDISGFALTLGELAGAAVWTLVR